MIRISNKIKTLLAMLSFVQVTSAVMPLYRISSLTPIPV